MYFLNQHALCLSFGY